MKWPISGQQIQSPAHMKQPPETMDETNFFVQSHGMGLFDMNRVWDYITDLN